MLSFLGKRGWIAVILLAIHDCRLLPALRYFHTSTKCRAADKQLLSKLRKSTGFSFVNCRQALEKFENDIKKAESWLREQAQKEGWAKASKLQGRPMSHGLISVAVHKKMAAMVEVNCETDFVARNSRFQNFASLITGAFLQHGIDSEKPKISINSKSFGSLCINDQLVKDLTALEVGNIGENIAVRRGVFIRASKDEFVSSYVHSTGPKIHSAGSMHQCIMGKYGSLVLYSINLDPALTPTMPHDELGRQLCQHIVGMNPKSIGSYEDTPCENSDDETKLIHQEYMLDTNLTVGNVLQQNGLTVLDFVRLECGETPSGEWLEDQEAAASNASVSG